MTTRRMAEASARLGAYLARPAGRGCLGSVTNGQWLVLGAWALPLLAGILFLETKPGPGIMALLALMCYGAGLAMQEISARSRDDAVAWVRAASAIYFGLALVCALAHFVFLARD